MPLYFGNTPISNVAATIGSSNSSGGSGGIETCTVNVVIDSKVTIAAYFYSKSVNGENSCVYEEYSGTLPSNITLTFENVICGSLIKLVCYGISLGAYSNEARILSSNYYLSIEAPKTAGMVGTINIYGDD